MDRPKQTHNRSNSGLDGKTGQLAEDWGDGHYAVAVGYDQQNIYLMDPSILGNYGYILIYIYSDRNALESEWLPYCLHIHFYN